MYMKVPANISEAFLFIALTIVISIFIVCQASASTLELPMDFEYSNGTEPTGVKPWATATFVDTSSNTVTLTMSAANLVGSEFISVWLFNFDPILNPELLIFNAVSTSATGPINITTGIDDLKAGPSKSYDIKFDFPTANGKSSNRFTAGESIVYDIKYTGSGTINVSSFNFESTKDGGDGPYHSAMHIQSIGPGGKSGWVGSTTVVPEPVSFILFLSGGAVLGFRRYWKTRQS